MYKHVVGSFPKVFFICMITTQSEVFTLFTKTHIKARKMTEVIRSMTTSKEVHVEGSLKERQKHGIASIGKLLREINNSLKPTKK